MNLITFLSQHYLLDESQKKTINAAFTIEEYPKGSIFLKPNTISKNLIFLEEGLYRTYYTMHNKTITHHFWDENSFNCSIECVYYNEPALYGWEALENCRIRSISSHEFQSIFGSIYEINTTKELFLIAMIKVFMDRIYALQFHNAEKKYDNLIKSQPNILRRASLGHIASYIGITQQRLSVIRGEKKSNKHFSYTSSK